MHYKRWGRGLPDQWGHILIISHSEEDIPLLELVDEMDPEGVGLEGDHLPQVQQDVHAASSMCWQRGRGQGSVHS